MATRQGKLVPRGGGLRAPGRWPWVALALGLVVGAPRGPAPDHLALISKVKAPQPGALAPLLALISDKGIG